MRIASVCVAVGLTLCFANPNVAMGIVPSEVNFQGILTGSNGLPAPTGTYFIRFRIYNSSVGGAVLWESESFGDPYVPVQVKDGRYDYLLGSHGPLPPSLADYASYWLGVKVGPGEAEMTPRTKLVSVPFALKTQSAIYADSAIASMDKTIDASELTTGELGFDRFSAFDELTDEGRIGYGGNQVARGLHIHGGLPVPVGGIVAWLKSYPNTPALSADFVECNGQILVDSVSVYDGQIIPDLNSQNRFLRGGPSPGATGGSESHRHSHLSNPSEDFGTGSARMTDENHLPPFYEVVWIMRVR